MSWDPDSIITIPTNDDVYFYQEATVVKYPNITEVWTSHDGYKLSMKDWGMDSIQNHLYNDWFHGHCIDCLFCLNPDSKIRMCVLNASGTFHGTTMAFRGIYGGMEKVCKETGEKVVVDSAFNCGKRDHLIKSFWQAPMDCHIMVVNHEATVIIPLIEWGYEDDWRVLSVLEGPI